LARMGVLLPEGAGAAFEGIRYVDGDVVAEGRFAHGAGRGVRRTVLSQALLARAKEVGADVRFETPLRAWSRNAAGRGVRAEIGGGAVEAHLLVAADGLHSRIRRAAGLEARAPVGRARHGLRRHFALSPWSALVEVHWVDGAEAYVTPVARDEVGIALL